MDGPWPHQTLVRCRTDRYNVYIMRHSPIRKSKHALFTKHLGSGCVSYGSGCVSYGSGCVSYGSGCVSRSGCVSLKSGCVNNERLCKYGTVVILLGGCFSHVWYDQVEILLLCAQGRVYCTLLIGNGYVHVWD